MIKEEFKHVKLFPMQENLIEEMAKVQPIADELEALGYIYAPYIPLQISLTPTLNISDLITPKKYTIRKYTDIYSDIDNRFEILDL